ncbi:MAG: glucosamine-6-phosphate deaminase [Coriobacteriales bacterium]
MKFIVAKDYEEMSRKAADVIAALVAANPSCTLGLATGSTPEGLYAELVRDFQAGKISFKDVSTYNLDEYRGLENSHPQSYHYFMEKRLFDHVDIDKAATHVPDGSNPDAAAACADYEAAIQAAGGVDLQLLGLGHNGHIGFNEPADEFAKETNCVTLTASTIEANSRLFDHIDEVPTQAYTMGIGTIMRASKILVVANGEGKAQIVRDAFFGPVTPQVPASILQFHPDVTVIVDEAAASLCK